MKNDEKNDVINHSTEKKEQKQGIEKICFERKHSHLDILNVSSLSLAFLGDAVWSLLVRNYFCERTTYKNTSLHRFTTRFVKASYQASLLDKINPILSQNELDIARRARNTKLSTVAKNASLSDYKKATSLEAILGYHYMSHNFDRIYEIFNYSVEDLQNILEEKKK